MLLCTGLGGDYEFIALWLQTHIKLARLLIETALIVGIRGLGTVPLCLQSPHTLGRALLPEARRMYLSVPEVAL